MGKNFEIKTKVNGEAANLSLTEMEVDSAISVCDGNGIDKVFTVKGDKGAAQFFQSEQNAMNFQDRAKIDFMFILELSELKKFNKTKGLKNQKPE